MEKNKNDEGNTKMENAVLQSEAPVVVKRKPGRRRIKPASERAKNIHCTISPLAYENYLKLEMPSKRISDFLERIKKEIETE